jgi:MYXO-CTERM domain-containing protein
VFSYTPGAQSFTITLNNLLPDINNAGQLVTDVQFTTALAGISLTSSSGTEVTIDGSGNPTVGSSPVETGWAAGSISTNTWLLCVICTGNVHSSVTPSHGIVPIEGSYSSGNGSIKNNGPHNPFLESGATFDFSTTSVLPSNPSIDPFSNVSISFGTTFGELPTTGSAPEPLTPLLAGAGLIVLGLIERRRRRSRPNA